jgi:hypothetical protein
MTIGPMDWAASTNPMVNAAAFQAGTLYASFNMLDDGDPGLEQLVTVDRTTGHVTPIGLLPINTDALDALPASVTVARLAGASWRAPRPLPAVAEHVAHRPRASVVKLDGRTWTPPKGRTPTSLAALARGAVIVTSSDGTTHQVTAADLGSYAVRLNHRGAAKLVDTRTGRTVLRQVVSIVAR